MNKLGALLFPVTIMVLLSGLLPAQEGPGHQPPEFALFVEVGFGGVISAPCASVDVEVRRTGIEPFSGRLVVEFGGMGRRFGRDDEGTVTIIREAGLAANVVNKHFHVDLPFPDHGGGGNIEVRLEKAVGEGLFSPVVSENTYISGGASNLIGFISSTRLAELNGISASIVEITRESAPESWKPLAGFMAIILNDDSLSQEQYLALEDYVNIGGTLIISPRSVAAFAPEAPLVRLLGVDGSAKFETVRLGSHGWLLGMTGASEEYGEGGPYPAVMSTGLEQPDEEEELVVWSDFGRSTGGADRGDLVSIANVGAGRVVYIHTDISRVPCVVQSGSAPTIVTAQLLNEALSNAIWREPVALPEALQVGDVGRRLDIAGKRIPGREVLIVLLALYLFLAGLGVFLAARRIKRPELFPAILLGFAAVMVGTLFVVGELYRRTGEDAKAAHFVVTDSETGRGAMFTLSNAYVRSSSGYRLSSEHDELLSPIGATMRFSSFSFPGYVCTTSGAQTTTEMTELDRWQNLFFRKTSPKAPTWSIEVRDLQGGYRLSNTTGMELEDCLLVIGVGAQAGLGIQGDWHYVEKVAPGAEFDFGGSTRVEEINCEGMPNWLRTRFDRERISPSRELLRELAVGSYGENLSNFESRFRALGVMPAEGEFVFLAIAPGDALDASRIGSEQHDDVEQICLWLVRGRLAR